MYGSDTLKRLALTPTAKYLGLQPKKPAKEEDHLEVSECEGTKSPVERPASTDSLKSRSVKTQPEKTVVSRKTDKDHESVSSKAKSYVGKLPGLAIM